jgi:hypothetical protein
MMSLERLYYKSFAGLKKSMFVVPNKLLDYNSQRRTKMEQYAAYLGIDWADKKHDLCLVEA